MLSEVLVGEATLLGAPEILVDVKELVADIGKAVACFLSVLLLLDGVGVDVQNGPNNVLSKVGHSVDCLRRHSVELPCVLCCVGCDGFVLMSKSNLS